MDTQNIHSMVQAIASLGKFINVTSMLSVKGSGRPVANQFVLTYENGQVFKSYNTLIAVRRNDGAVFLQEPNKTHKGHDGHYSSTTQTYCNKFLGGINVATMRKKIAAGDYKVVSAI